MSEKTEKVRGIFYDDVNSKHSSTRTAAITIGLVGVTLLIIHAFAGWPSLRTAGNDLLELAKWLFTAIVLRSAVVQSVRSWGWGASTTTANIPQPPPTQTPSVAPENK